MKIGSIIMLGLLVAPPALGQTVDWCNSPLPFQADPNTALVWRLRCTIQILDRERAEAMDHVTTAEIDKAVAEAHLKGVQAQLEEDNKKLEEANKKLAPTATVPSEKKK